MADAVRFSVTADVPGSLRLTYILEKDHAPAEFGALEFSIAEGVFLEQPPSEILARQAESFVRSYLALTRGLKAWRRGPSRRAGAIIGVNS
jgi:hypothetical protein